jgi:heme O synthase-like polyprenyltransferase
MTVPNVGTVEATLRVVVAGMVNVVALAFALAYPQPITAAALLVAVVGGALMMRSALTQRCPIHEKYDIDTTRR